MFWRLGNAQVDCGCCEVQSAILIRGRQLLVFMSMTIVLMLIMPCLADCPEQWSSIKDFCLRMTKDHSSTFRLAEQACRKLHPSAHLASLHSIEENLAAGNSAKNQSVWIGLKRVKNRWRWSDRTFVDFTNWPTDKHGQQKLNSKNTCSQLSHDQKWRQEIACGSDIKSTKGKKGKNSSKHSKSKRRVGQQMQGRTGMPSLCKVPHMQTCGGADWIRAGEFCYNFSSPLEKKSWNEASAGCLEIDAKFVAIFNAKQNDVLRRLAHLTASNVWIGLIHTADGFHRWVDGSIMSFDNFSPTDNYDDDHKCVFMEDLTGLWQHEPCSTTLEYVCMRPKLQLYDPRSMNASRPHATVEIWRRVEEALVPAREPPVLKTTKKTTRRPRTLPPAPEELRTSLREEVDEGPEKISAGISTDTRNP